MDGKELYILLLYQCEPARAKLLQFLNSLLYRIGGPFAQPGKVETRKIRAIMKGLMEVLNIGKLGLHRQSFWYKSKPCHRLILTQNLSPAGNGTGWAKGVPKFKARVISLSFEMSDTLIT